MLQVVLSWNLSKPSDDLKKLVKGITLRGYNPETFLTGEFARKVAARLELDGERAAGRINAKEYNNQLAQTGAIAPLSVSAIADKYCHTRRDLYLGKGPQPQKSKNHKTWGKIAGPLVEKYVFSNLTEAAGFANYSQVIARGRTKNSAFMVTEKKSIYNLGKTEGINSDARIGDTEWFAKLLDFDGRASIAMKILNDTLGEEDSIKVGDISRSEIMPNSREIGISQPASPDFIIPTAETVGDVKTGVAFAAHHQLTCAGYALAYENQDSNKKAKIDWGIIYFFPTRNPTAYVKPITFAQVYIFPIDDILRRWFLRTRNEAYKIISSNEIPPFPSVDERSHCCSCGYLEYCKENGL